MATVEKEASAIDGPITNGVCTTQHHIMTLKHKLPSTSFQRSVVLQGVATVCVEREEVSEPAR